MTHWSLFLTLWSYIVCLSSPSVGLSESESSRPRRMMLLVNPQSGKGQALTLYNNHIQRLLNEAGVPHTLVITGESITLSCSVQHHARKTKQFSLPVP